MSVAQMSKKQKVIEFSKRLVVNAAINAMPNSVQLLISTAQDFHELFLAAPKEEQQALIEGAGSMSEAELALAQAEVARESGVDDEQAVSVVLQSLRGLRGTGDREVLRSVNATLGAATRGEATISPRGGGRLNTNVVGTMLGEASRGLEVSGRGSWPTVEGFELKGVLGRGAAGVVYLAKEEASGRVCALKVGELESQSRFEREVRAMGAVEHPNLIDLWGHGLLSEPPPRYWISMPNVGGLTLSDVWRRGVEVDEKLRLMGEVLAGLKALHSHNMAHRDLKPANALVTPLLEVRLADFGLSKDAVRGAEATMTATSMGLEGTPAYMSPEQVKEQRGVGAEVDVWAFGVMLYEALKGVRPFEGQNLMYLGMEILTKQLDLESGVPVELQPVLKKALSRDLSERYPSALELELPYREGASVVISRVQHNRRRPAWEEARASELLLSLTGLEVLADEGWQGELKRGAPELVEQALQAVQAWQSLCVEAEQGLARAREASQAFSVQKLSRSAQVAQAALSAEAELEAQWRAWHEGLCALEREELEGLRAQGELEYRVSALPTLKGSLGEAVTAEGRADFDDRQADAARALALYQDQLHALGQEAPAQGARAAQRLRVGGSREADCERAVREGEAQGRAAAESWLEHLRASLGLDETGVAGREAQWRAALSRARSSWAQVARSAEVDHDRAAAAWRWALEEGRLARFCLDLARAPVAELVQKAQAELSPLLEVDARRLAEVCSLGVEGSLEPAARLLRAEANAELVSAAQAQGEAWLQASSSASLGEAQGVARLERLGGAVGLIRGGRAVLSVLERPALGWSQGELSGVGALLSSALSDDLRALDELVAEAQARRARRVKLLAVVLVACVVAVGGVLAYSAAQERARVEAAERAEAERKAAAERAEAERKAAAKRAEAERKAAAKRAECIASIVFIKIPAGSFQMGSTEQDYEQPIHTVQVPAFLMSKTEVTVGQYRTCVEAGRCTEPDTSSSYCNWDKSGREDHPINCVDWGQARTFAKWVGANVDLPTEAEWEYAARGGQSYKYAGSNNPDEVAWYKSNTNGTKAVGTKRANEYGLHDMSGNVWEWTLDEWHDSYSGAPSNGSKAWGGVPTCRQECDTGSARRVLRGGGWGGDVVGLRVADRNGSSPGLSNPLLGFRLRRTRSLGPIGPLDP